MILYSKIIGVYSFGAGKNLPDDRDWEQEVSHS